MKVFVLIYQKPLKIRVYSSLVALIEDNNLDDLGASKSKLEKHPFNNFDYVTHKVIISKKETLSSGDVRQCKKIKHMSKTNNETVPIHFFENEKDYTLLLSNGDKVQATFYKRRYNILLPEMSVTFNPSIKPTEDTAIAKEIEYIDTFFTKNEPIANNHIDCAIIENKEYKIVR